MVGNVFGKKELTAGFKFKLVRTESYCCVYTEFCVVARGQAFLGSCELIR